MIRRSVYVLISMLAALLCSASLATAQETPVTSATSTSTESTPLRRLVSLHIERVPLAQALTMLSNAAGVRVVYGPKQIPVDKLVSVSGESMTVSDALAVMLDGTGVSVSLSPSGWILLTPPRSHTVSLLPQAQGSATITGLVTDSGTGAIITQAVVHIDGTQLTTHTNATGHYTFGGLAAGEYRVTVRRVGYLAKTRTVTLTDGETKTVDFDLNPPATQLNEVVTTALGEQRRYEVGNVISTINVDSIAPDAPVMSVTDLISGRAPGVEVMESSGLVGGGEDIRIRGISSMLLQSDPIIIVDGIREDNTPGGVATLRGYEPGPSRINDIDFSQIASIDILKGPTATTEYGTDAANGVIVITTKRGLSGHPQWTVSADYTALEVPTASLPNYYWNWGVRTNGSASTNIDGRPCLLVPLSAYGKGFPDLTDGGCVVDSVTAFNPEKHTATSEYGTGPSTKYDLGVGGGSDALRYYFAGGWNSVLGPTHVPTVFLSEAQAYGFPESALDPNSQTQSNIRANTTIRVSPTVDVLTSVAYMSTEESTPSATTRLGITSEGPLVNDSMYNYGYGLGTHGNSPLASLGTTSNQQTERWTGSSSINMRPASWLATTLTVGIDHGAQTETAQQLPVVGLVDFGDTVEGSITQQQTTNDIYTVDFRGNVTTTLFHVRAMTSFGLQFEETSYNGLEGAAYDLSPSDFSLLGSGSTEIEPLAQQEKTGGAYVEENFGVGDRCYIPIALRLDAGSGFGASVAGGSASYPKYGISCLVLTGPTTLRVRGAFGVSGQQPPYGAALQQYQQVTLGSGGAYDFGEPGNATLQAERSQEFEGGFDVGLWRNRIQGEFSGYSKATQHALYTLSPGFDLEGEYTENIGEVKNTGWEATLSAILLQSRRIDWSVNVMTSVNNNKLVEIAPGIITSNVGEGGERFAQGYPLYGYWAKDVHYADLNRDGILEIDEVTVDTADTYQSSSLPPNETSVASSVSLWRGALVMNAMFDYKAGYKVFNGDIPVNLAGANDPVAPLWQQAMEIGPQLQNNDYTSLNYFSGTFLRFRELSVACALPRSWGHALRRSNLSLVAAVRNLALWTQYPFGDPEVSDGQTISQNSASNVGSINNDARETSTNVVPLNRQWTLRLNVGW